MKYTTIYMARPKAYIHKQGQKKTIIVERYYNLELSNPRVPITPKKKLTLQIKISSYIFFLIT